MLSSVVLVSISDLTNADVFVNHNKGFALRRIGMYSTSIVEQIIHSIVPLNDLCATEPTTNICSYSDQLRKTKIFQLASVLSYRDVVEKFSYDKENVSRSIGNDIVRLFTQHHPHQFFNKDQDMIHFTNNQFYRKNRNEQSIQSTSENNLIDNVVDIPQVRLTPAQHIIHRVNNQKIDLEYLSPDDQEIFSSAISSNSNEFSNTQEVINVFTEHIIGQSIYGLPYCSLAEEKPQNSQPCLVISTLFITIPANHHTIFPVYELIPLPIVVDQKKYIYENLPTVVAINSIDNTVLTWQDDTRIKTCTFSKIVFCAQKTLSVSLSKPSCLGQLLDEHQSSTSLCDVHQSINIQDDIIRISDGLWLFYNVQETTTCQLYSNSNALPELISIKQPAILSIACEKTMTCVNFQLPPTSCKRDYLIKTPSFDFTVKNSSRSIIPITNMSNTIIAAYRTHFNKTIDELKTIFKTNQATIYQTIADLATYVISFLSFIFIVAFLRCLTIMKFKLEKEMKTLLHQLRDLLGLQKNKGDLALVNEP